MFILLSDDFTGESLPLSLSGSSRQELFSCCPDLWVLVNLLGVLLITVNVEPDGCSSTACTAETENNSGTIGKDDPKALREEQIQMKKPQLADIRRQNE